MACGLSRHFWTPPHRNLLPCHPPKASLSQVLSLRDQTLVNRTGEQGDAVPAHLIAKVLAGDADGTGTGWLQDIPVQVIPLLCVCLGIGGRHSSTASTPVLLATDEVVKGSKGDLIRRHLKHLKPGPAEDPGQAGQQHVLRQIVHSDH